MQAGIVKGLVDRGFVVGLLNRIKVRVHVSMLAHAEQVHSYKAYIVP